jgi:hypothetical protein
MNDARAKMMDELLGKKLQTREGRKKVALLSASYLRDMARETPNLGNKMLPRIARTLDALASELEGQDSTLPPCIANQVREKLCEQSSEQSPE